MNASVRDSAGDGSGRRDVLAEQVRLGTSTLLTAVAASVPGVLLFGYALYGWRWPVVMQVWALAVLAISLVEWALIARTRNRLDDARVLHRYVLAHVATNFAAGTLWGTAAVLFYEPDPVRLTVLGIMLLANLCGVALGCAALMPSVYAFGVPLVLPFVAWSLTQDYELARLLGLTVVLLAIVMAVYAHDLNRTILRSIETRFENRRLYEELTEQRVRERTRVLEEANRHKSEFLATMSHELRTPLNAIIGYSEMLQEDAQAQGAGALIADLAKIHTAGRQLLELINAVLDLSKIEAGKMELQPETRRVAEFLPEITAVIEPLVARNGNRFEVTLHGDVGSIRADPTKVRQVLLNVLGNACKFTHQGTVSLRIWRRQTGSGDVVEFVVADTGIGMTAEQQARLFNDFMQADSTVSRRYGGTGLGLALSRRLCRLMGGDIAVRSEAGRGTTFTVQLPTGAAAPPPPSPPQRVDSPGVILVINDDVAVAEMLCRHLERYSLVVITASDGPQDLRLVRDVSPDVITVDGLLQGLKSRTVLMAPDPEPAACDIPIVIVSVGTDCRADYEHGTTKRLLGPVDRARLLRQMRRYRSGDPVQIVVDDAPLRQHLREVLESEGYPVVEGDEGAAAIERIVARRPRAVGVDLGPQGIECFEWLRTLRRDPHGQELTAIAIAPQELSIRQRAQLETSILQFVQRNAVDCDLVLADISCWIAESQPSSPRRPHGPHPTD